MTNRVRSKDWLSKALAIVLLASLSLAAQCGKTEEPKTEGETLPPTPTETISVRQEINTFSADQVDALRKGVALMQQRENTTPTSWIYQANIHGVPAAGDNCPASTDPMQPAWATCQHGSFYFLAWHRIYLYYFERILRSSIQEATGDPNYVFALPYWDYANGSPQLPAPFTTPADSSTNPLYVAQRRTSCNTAVAGQDCVTAAQGSADQALLTVPVCSCPDGEASCDGCIAGLLPDESFHGLFSATPQHFLSGFGELESQPHNTIHNRVGSFSGWMSDPNCAARDAIFWLHHANIDRLWQVWLNQNADRLNPIGSNAWTTTTFTFFDADGSQVQMTGCQILNMATQLDYQYQDLPVENVVLCDESAAASKTAAAPKPEDSTATASMASLARSAAKETVLSGSTVETTVALPAPQRERVRALAAQPAPEKLRLVIEGLKLTGKGGVFEIYLNLAKGATPDPKGASFVGHLSVFGHVGHEVARSYDVTDELRDFLSGGGTMGDLKLTFVPVGNEEAKGKSLLTFRSASLVTREK